jgi:formylglycine-generating enzyme required for sulfatase activity
MPPIAPPMQKEDRECQGCPEMVHIPRGTFTMGSNDDPSEKPVRTIRVGEFSMSRYPVTIKEWRQCHAANICPIDVRVTNRAYYDVGVRYPAHGFRVVRPMKTGG